MLALAAFPPALFLIVVGMVLPLVNPKVGKFLLIATPLMVLWSIWQMPDGHILKIDFLEYELLPLKIDSLSRLFATIFAIMVLAGGVFAWSIAKPGELMAAYLYAGSAIGVAMAGDLISVFVFWEIMAVGSTLIIWSNGTAEAHRAGLRYVMLHLFGGVVLMVGIVSHISETGIVLFEAMQPDGWPQYLILAGFLINAGAPPLSAWISDAYVEASPSGMVFLSAFTTKTAVYVLLRGFPGTEILIFIGLYMIFYGIVYALLENDMRRILAYSIVNQVGFMITGIGIGTAMSLNGAAAHAFTHIIYKALLLMSAGSVLFMTGKRKCTDLGGLFRSMPLTMVCGTIGALAISSFPLTSGFISKSMINQSAADEGLLMVWFLLAAASAGVFLHAGIKFPWFVFFQKDSGLRPPDPRWSMRIAMVFFAVLCVALGVFPGPLYAILPFPVDYVPYTFPHIVAQIQLLLFSGLAFFVMLPAMKRTLTITLDFDWFYKKFAPHMAKKMQMLMDKLAPPIIASTKDQFKNLLEIVIRHHRPEGVMARTLPTGTTVLFAIILLAAFLIASLYVSAF